MGRGDPILLKFALHTIVGRGSPRPVLHGWRYTPPKKKIMLGAGGWGTEATILLKFALHTIVERGLRAPFSSNHN